MIKNTHRAIISLILVVLSAVSGFSQDAFGPHRLVNIPAPTLRNPTHVSLGVGRASFLGRIGGVAFDGVAKADTGFTFRNLSISYDPGEPDGERLRVRFDNREVTAPICDWQLIPIAQFANSPNYSCVTLFGTLGDDDKDLEVMMDKGTIINYHDQFVNTLLGLRLFQLDILMEDQYATDLPMKDGEYILGKGERAPQVKLNKAGFSDFRAYLTKLMRESHEQYSSYLISDLKSDIRFGISGDSLSITGAPNCFFWRTDSHSVLDVEEKIDSELRTAERKLPFNAKQWFISRVLEDARVFERDYNVEAAAFVPFLKDLLSKKGDVVRRRYLQQQTVEWLHSLLISIRETMAEQRPVSMTEVSKQVSANTELLRKINPAIWDSGVNVMRYAAFFRFCKSKSPQQWRTFTAQIRRIHPSPSVTTPTVVYFRD